MRIIVALLFLLPTWAPADESSAALEDSVQQLRSAIGEWTVTTEFLNEDGSVANSAEGIYHFEWVVEDRVVSGYSEIPSLDMRAGLLFYINEAEQKIEMVSVAKDGRLWVMTGPLGGETRYTERFETQSGGEGQLRFTRFNVQQDSFESRMEYTEDGGVTWKPGNHQVFTRAN